nr:hypothetical protein BaRGS_014575 [Batillaria attramentaria]
MMMEMRMILVGDESLLMYIVQQNAVTSMRKWFQTILEELKQSLAGHRTVQFLHSVEASLEFLLFLKWNLMSVMMNLEILTVWSRLLKPLPQFPAA